MGKNTVNYIDRFSYVVFVLNSNQKVNIHKKDHIARMLRSLYPDEVAEKDIYPVRNFKRAKKALILVNKSTKPPEGLCTTLLCCHLFSRYTGTILYAASDFFEYVHFENGVLLESRVCIRDGNTKPDLKDVQLCVGLYKDLPSGCPKTVGFASLQDIARKYPEAILGAKEFFTERYLKRFLFIVGAVALALIGLSHLYTIKKEAERNRHRIAAEKREAQAKQKEQEAYLDSLREKYIAAQKKVKLTVYKMLASIYTLIGEAAEVSSITVSGNTFQMEARSSDAIKILQAFEKAEFVTQVEMQRIAVESSKEYFSMQGTMRYVPPQLPVFNNAAEEIDLYEKRLSEMESGASGQKKSLSGTVSVLRTYLHNNNCKETLLQYIKTDTGEETECTLKCKASDFFNFLQSVDASDVPFYLTLLRIKTTEGGIDVVFRIKEGRLYIPEEFAHTAVKGQTLAKIFRYPKVQKQDMKPFVRQQSVQQDVPAQTAVKENRALTYVGAAKIANMQYVFIKDSKTNTVYKLPLNAAEGNRYRMLSDNVFEVRIDGTNYEVRK